jgi:Bax protein
MQHSRMQAFLVFALGLMVLGQVGVGLYQGPCSHQSSEETFYETLSHAASAKAFGFILPQEKHFHAATVNDLDNVFEECDFSLEKAKLEGRAPRLYLAKLPKGMKRKTASSKKAKQTFIKVVLPHVLRVNEKILADRKRLLSLQAKQKQGRHLLSAEKRWLRELAANYRSKSTRVDVLLHHVDVVPPSLALAQAILESGWGTSHAAVEKNSTFGHMRTKTKVQKFESLLHNVAAYIQNLNRHSAYGKFRRIRADLRKKNQEVGGYVLASGLEKYSVRGNAYIKDLQRLIKNYNLGGYDHITLDQHMRMKP